MKELKAMSKVIREMTTVKRIDFKQADKQALIERITPLELSQRWQHGAKARRIMKALRAAKEKDPSNVSPVNMAYARIQMSDPNVTIN
jgi:hypothetical protein